MSETEGQGMVVYRTIGQGVKIALQGFNQIVNDGTSLPEYALVARDASDEKGGALEISSGNTAGFVADEASTRLTIPVLHGGFEYSDYPSLGMRLRFTQLIQQGADLVVAHHPHTVQGVGIVHAGGQPHYVLMSLGNFLFDQDVFETFQSYLAAVDVDEVAPGKAGQGGGGGIGRLVGDGHRGRPGEQGRHPGRQRLTVSWPFGTSGPAPHNVVVESPGPSVKLAADVVGP